MHARAVNPGGRAQELRADYRRAGDGWPMVGFIFMVDECRRDNGATRFVPGWPDPRNFVRASVYFASVYCRAAVRSPIL